MMCFTAITVQIQFQSKRNKKPRVHKAPELAANRKWRSVSQAQFVTGSMQTGRESQLEEGRDQDRTNNAGQGGGVHKMVQCTCLHSSKHPPPISKTTGRFHSKGIRLMLLEQHEAICRSSVVFCAPMSPLSPHSTPSPFITASLRVERNSLCPL